MKKVLAVSMALVLCLLMGAFTQSAPAYTTYANAIKNTQYDAVQVKYEGTVNYIDELNGRTDMLFQMDVKQVAVEEDIEMEMDIAFFIGTDIIRSKAYYADGTVYQVIGDETVSYPLTTADAMEEMNLNNIDFASTAVRASGVRTDFPGETRLNFDLYPDSFNGLLRIAMNSYADLSVEEMKVEKLQYNIVLDEDDVIDTVNIQMQLAYGAFVRMNYNMDGKVVATGDAVTVSIPAELVAE